MTFGTGKIELNSRKYYLKLTCNEAKYNRFFVYATNYQKELQYYFFEIAVLKK